PQLVRRARAEGTMTEAEWLASREADRMVDFLLGRPALVRRKAGRRKLRLFGCACCRRVWDLLTDPRRPVAVEVAERLADGEATPAEVEGARQQADRAYGEVRGGADQPGTSPILAAQAAVFVLDGRADRFARADMVWTVFAEDDTPWVRAYRERQ